MTAAEFFDYTSRMARPRKYGDLPMDTDLRIPMTSEQKTLIDDATADEPEGKAAWARAILLAAAQEEDRKAGRGEGETRVKASRADSLLACGRGPVAAIADGVRIQAPNETCHTDTDTGRVCIGSRRRLGLGKGRQQWRANRQTGTSA